MLFRMVRIARYYSEAASVKHLAFAKGFAFSFLWAFSVDLCVSVVNKLRERLTTEDTGNRDGTERVLELELSWGERGKTEFEPDQGVSYHRCSRDAEGSHNGSAAVLKTAGRKAMQVRVLSPPPFLFNNLPRLINHAPSVPVATWRDFGALLIPFGLGRNCKGFLFRESTAVRRFSGIA